MTDFRLTKTRRKGKPFEVHLAECRRGPDECWLWPVPGNDFGHGATFYNGKTEYAHRAVYDYLVGPIPEGLTLDHLCRVPGCVNPAHLEPCTLRDNILRSNCLGARNARKETCRCGRTFDSVRVIGHRQERACSHCASEHAKAWYRRNPEWVRLKIAAESERRRRECTRGHVRTPENTLIAYRKGVELRYCLECRAAKRSEAAA